MATNWGAVGGGAISGAQAGSAFGPWGTAVGGVLGGLTGLFGSNSADEKEQAQMALQRELLNRAVYTPFQFYGPGGMYAQAGARDVGGGQAGTYFTPSFAQLAGMGGVQAGGPGGMVGGPANFMPVAGGNTLAGAPVTGGGNMRQWSPDVAAQFGGAIGGEAPGTRDIAIGLGDLEPIRGGLVQLAGQQLGRAGLQGVPQGVLDAAQSTMGYGPGSINYDPYTLAALQGQAAGAGGLAYSGLFQPQNPLARLLQNTSYAGAVGQAEAAGQDQSAVQQQVLEQLRASAMPAERQQTQSLFNKLFSTGRLGTSGGAEMAQQLSEAQAQADLQRQLAARGEGRATQAQALGLAQGLGGIGGGQQSLQDQLLSQAFGRWGQTAQVGADLSNTAFGRSLSGAQFGLAAGGQNFGQQAQLASLQPGLQGAWLNNALQALQGQSGLTAQGLQGLQAALSASQLFNQSQTMTATSLAKFADPAAFGGSSEYMQGLFSNLAGNKEAIGTIGGWLGGVFGGNKSGSTPPILPGQRTA